MNEPSPQSLPSPSGPPFRSWTARISFRIAGTFAIGVGLGWFCAIGHINHQAGLNLSLMGQAVAIVQQNYVDRQALQSKRMTYGAISGMVNSLGDFGHTTFLPPDLVNELKKTERGEFKGIGVEIQMHGGSVVVAAPIDGSPAQKAGLRPGDTILKVNGENVAGWPLNRVAQQITGPAGTSVRLTILDPRANATREISVTRASISVHDVTWAAVPGTDLAHLRISSFDRNVASQFHSALAAIQARHLHGVVLDLRNNPGGILDGAVAVASEFVATGNVLLVKNANGQIQPVSANKGGLATNLPVVVLINKGTASAAEIVAGALQDRRSAELVGETTFGTGTVLGEFKLTDGSALLLAIAEWLTPDGQSFWHKGLDPQIKVSLPNDVFPLLPEAEHGMTPEEFKANADRQLQRAVNDMAAQTTKQS